MGIHILNGNSADPDQLTSQLVCIYTDCKGRAYPGSAGFALTLSLVIDQSTIIASLAIKMRLTFHDYLLSMKNNKNTLKCCYNQLIS